MRERCKPSLKFKCCPPDYLQVSPFNFPSLSLFLSLSNYTEWPLSLSSQSFDQSMMWARFCGFLVLLVHILSLVGVSGRLLPPNHGVALYNQGPVQNHQPLQITHSSNKVIMGAEENGEKYKEIKKIGSKPPSCSHRCYGCMPCEPIQVPTTTSHVSVLYTNYEPEGWKCKCGPTFYSP